MDQTQNKDSALPTPETGHKGKGGPHVLPINLYLGVYLGLLLLTALTVLVSFANLESASVPAAMTVAVVKAGLVIGFFMHLRYDTRFNSLVFFTGIAFLLIFFSFTMIDLTSRGGFLREADTHAYWEESAEVEAEAAWNANQPPVQLAEGSGQSTEVPTTVQPPGPGTDGDGIEPVVPPVTGSGEGLEAGSGVGSGEGSGEGTGMGEGSGEGTGMGEGSGEGTGMGEGSGATR